MLVDEISMISGEFLDRLGAELRHLRKNNDPFGGIQMIFCGDPLQLRPILETYDPTLKDHLVKTSLTDHSAYVQDSNNDMVVHSNRGRFFQSLDFWQARPRCVVLRTCFRQSGDARFVHLLDRLRRCLGPHDPSAKAALDDLNSACLVNDDRVHRFDDGKKKNSSKPVVPLELLPTNTQVYRANARAYDAIKQDEHVFVAENVQVPFKVPRPASERTRAIDSKFRDFLVPEQLGLKPGASVLLLSNLELPDLYNGRQGVVQRWATFREMHDKARALAHNLRRVTDLDASPANWQNAVDVAGSLDSENRVDFARVLADIGREELDKIETWTTQPPEPRQGIVEKRLYAQRREQIQIERLLRLGADKIRAPWVLFPAANGLSERLELVVPDLHEIEAPGFGIARRINLPLVLAYAISVHKSQGMGLDNLRYDPRANFADGMAYVALSRATSIAGLQLASPLRIDQVLADPDSVHFLDLCEQAQPGAPLVPDRAPPPTVQTWHHIPLTFKGRRRGSGSSS